jgi:hypothetical protein
MSCCRQLDLVERIEFVETAWLRDFRQLSLAAQFEKQRPAAVTPPLVED